MKTEKVLWFSCLAALLAACSVTGEASVDAPNLRLPDGLDVGPKEPGYDLYRLPRCSAFTERALELAVSRPANAAIVDPIGGATVNIAMQGSGRLVWTSDMPVSVALLSTGTRYQVFDYAGTGSPSYGDVLGTPTGLPVTAVKFCYRPVLGLALEAEGAFLRSYTWRIENTASVDSLVLHGSQVAEVKYVVEATVDDTTDSAPTVRGTIRAENPSALGVIVDEVGVRVEGAGAAEVDCGADLPARLVPHGTLACGYSVPVADFASRVAQAFVVTGTGFVDGAATATKVVFGAPTDVAGECIAVKDDMSTTADTEDDLFLGELCATGKPLTFEFGAWIGANGPVARCRFFDVVNTARFWALDETTSGQASATVTVEVR